MSSSPSRKALLSVSALLALGLGGVALRGQVGPFAQAQTAQVQTKQAQTTPVQPFDAKRAKTENERNTVDVVRAAQDGLVYVSVQSGGQASAQKTQGGQTTPNPFAGTPFQNLPFGHNGLPGLQAQPQRGTGSGFFVNARGDILTNYHVVEGADTITIRVHNHPETYSAKVIGTAPDYDLALIRADKLPAGLVKPIALGDSDGLEPGLKAIALGAPFDLDFSVTEGIISAVARKIPVGVRGVSQAVIQTDAAINPGNSGGPLLDSSGQVIGINTQILTGGSDQNAGVGFAIPVNVARSLLPRLEAGAKISTPRLGIRYTNLATLDPAALKALRLPTAGALVLGVEPGSPAEQAGLKAGKQTVTLQDGTPLVLGGDIITGIDGKTLAQGTELQAAIFGRSVGDSVRLTVQRADQTLDLTVKLSESAPQASTPSQ
ncbi:S1C family serine protease [Deinococcus sp.]|uniref:S1C family serine protease n=1 Tax=Deinococcus sp. TaxID=47478 RepID=UPI003CC60CBC